MKTTCPRCGAEVGTGRFCTACGAALRPGSETGGAGLGARTSGTGAEPAQSRAPAPEGAGERGSDPAAARVVACPRCGAVNAASRRRCGRCHADLTADPSDAAAASTARDRAPASGGTGSPSRASVADDEDPPLPGVVVLAAAVAAVAVLAVGLTLLSARGVGPFAGPSAAAGGPTETVEVAMADVSASSALPAEGARSYGSDNLVDDDPTTAWNEGEPGDGTGERIDLVLSEPTRVTELLVWNGYQAEDFFPQHNRVRSLRLELGDRRFTVQLLDRSGPQAIELPEPVTTDLVRLTIASVYPGDRYNDAALSEIEVRGTPPAATPDAGG